MSYYWLVILIITVLCFTNRGVQEGFAAYGFLPSPPPAYFYRTYRPYAVTFPVSTSMYPGYRWGHAYSFPYWNWWWPSRRVWYY